MRLLVVNPNATAAMTETIAAAARAALGPAATVAAVTNEDGPPAIQGAADGEAAIPGTLARIEAGAREADAVLIACFDDTGLAEARAAAPVPVIGIGEAAYLAATLLGPRFSVVTTLAVSVLVLEANIAGMGLSPRCAKVRASGVPVLDLEHDPAGAAARVAAEVDRAAAEDGVASVVLGCAGMTAIAADLARGRAVRIVDPVRAAALAARFAVEATRHPAPAAA